MVAVHRQIRPQFGHVELPSGPCAMLPLIERSDMAEARFVVEQNKAGKWFWHQVAANGRKIATSGQSFASEQSATRAAAGAKLAARGAKVVVKPPKKRGA
jgi:uncharacterized protein YegP (UPF0339 family)